MSGQPIRMLEESKVQNEILDLIFKTFFDCGQKLDEKDAVLMAKSLAADIKNYFSTLTITEVKIAFKKGILKDFGEYYGLNIATFLNWLKNYMSLNDRIVVRRKLSDSNKKEVVLSPEQKEEIVKQGVLKCWQNFKEKKVVFDFGNASYNFLEKKGIINLTIGRKNEIKDQVKARMVQESIERSKSAKNSIEKRDLKGVIENLNKEIGNYKDQVVFECKREALRIFFSELIEIGEELKDLI